jgi:hypothetical protein
MSGSIAFSRVSVNGITSENNRPENVPVVVLGWVLDVHPSYGRGTTDMLVRVTDRKCFEIFDIPVHDAVLNFQLLQQFTSPD